MSPRDDSQTYKPFDLELDELLDPAGAFAHPRRVVDDADLTRNEKRAILARWASDACALETMPTLRRSPKGRRPVPIDDIFDALKELDRQAMDRSFIRVVRRSEIPGTLLFLYGLRPYAPMRVPGRASDGDGPMAAELCRSEQFQPTGA